MARKTPELPPHLPTRAMVRANRGAISPSSPVTASQDPLELEVSKARVVGFAPHPDLTIHFRRTAEHTDFGGAADKELRNSLRNEATEMAALIKQTVPTVTWDWLCKILSEEYTRTIAESERNLGKVRRYYGGNEVPSVVERFHKK